jgi:hypothetical protein
MGALLAQLLLLVGMNASFTFVDAERVHVPFQGALLATGGYMTCTDGFSEITLATRAPEIEATLAHELAHAADCLDDGELNGSPLPEGATLRQPISHCLADRVEFYACWAVEQGVAPSRVVVLGEAVAVSTPPAEE